VDEELPSGDDVKLGVGEEVSVMARARETGKNGPASPHTS
jgi:hypothetical protein